MELKRICLVSEIHGRYIPITFIRTYDMAACHCKNLAKAYIEADDEMRGWIWDDIVRDAWWVDDAGHRWTLHQDGDLYGIRDDYEWED